MTIRVPKTPRKAFDRARRPSALLLGQIEHLEWAVLPASQRKPDQLPTRKVTTEAQAAERVAQLMKMLPAPGLVSPAARTSAADNVPAPVVLPPLPKAATRRKRRPQPRTGKPASSDRRRRARR